VRDLSWSLQHKDGTLEHALKDRSLARLEHVLASDPSAATDPILSYMGFDTPICFAVREGCDAEIVCALLAAGADPHLSDGMGRTPLMICAGLYEVLPYETGSPPHRAGSSAELPALLLEIGCTARVAEIEERKQIKAALRLLARGADPNQLDPQGRTAGEIAIGCAQMRLASLMSDYLGIQAYALLERLHNLSDRSRCTLASLPAHVLIYIAAFLVPEDSLSKFRRRSTNCAALAAAGAAGATTAAAAAATH